MRQSTLTAIFDPRLRIAMITSTLIFQRIQRTVTEQTIKILWMLRLMAWKIFTFRMGKKRILFVPPWIFFKHILLLLVIRHPGIGGYYGL